MKPFWKKFWMEIALALCLGVVLPGSMLCLAIRLDDGNDSQDAQQPPSTVSQTEQTQPVSDEAVQIQLLKDGTVASMALEEYLVGVVLGEMPADFEPEAQKAQAVVARTFTLKTREAMKHEGGAVCTDSACCQAYMEPEEYLKNGGSLEGVERMRSAVKATEGLVLTYDGALIEATYFSCSGGRTEDAVAVWGANVPYLRSTDSPGEEQAAHYTDTVTFSKTEFAQALGLELTGDEANWLGYATYTAGGGVDTMTIGGKKFQGTELRKLLGLRSTAFKVAVEGENISITTRGYGHRVGMSQYGADAMAVQGKDYEEILAHYYQGTVLTAWTDD